MAEYKVVDAEKLDAELKSLADKIREKGGTTEELDFYEGDFTNAVGTIESGGGGTEEIENLIDQSGVLDSTDGTATDKVEQLIDKAEDESAWYQYTGTLTDIPRWSNATCETLPRMNLSKITSLSYKFFGMPNLKRVDFYINSESCTRADNVFSGSRQLEYVKGLYTAKCTTVEAVFNNCVSLKTIEEPLDFSLRNDSWSVFNSCKALENVRFISECIHTSINIPSPVLSDESIQSIIDGLADLTGGTAQTLTLNATVKAKLTDEQKKAISDKNWNLA